MQFDSDDYANRRKVCLNSFGSPDEFYYQWITPRLVVIRDDLLCGGTKSRFIKKILPLKYQYYVYVSPWWGGAQIALALAVRDINLKENNIIFPKKAIIITLKPKGATPAYILIAKELGAEIIYVSESWSEAENMAQEFIQKTPNCILLSSGFDSYEAIEEIRTIGLKILQELGQFDAVFSVAGSGTLTRGLQLSGLGKEYWAISVTYGIPDVGKAHLLVHHQHFDERIDPNNAPPFPSSSHYDAKGWYYAWQYSQEHPRKRVLFWNVM